MSLQLMSTVCLSLDKYCVLPRCNTLASERSLSLSTIPTLLRSPQPNVDGLSDVSDLSRNQELIEQI